MTGTDAETRRDGGRWWRLPLAAVFVACLLGAIFLFALYRWPRTNPLVHYFVVRPPWVWFGALAPLLITGLLPLRRRCFLGGCALFFLLFATTEEILPLIRPFRSQAREKFRTEKMAYASYMKDRSQDQGSVQIPLRILTWNVAGGRFEAEKEIPVLARLRPDIIFLQETGDNIELLNGLREHPHFSAYHESGDRQRIVSRFPVRKLDPTPLREYLGSAWELTVAPGRTMTCVNVHLSPQELRTQVLRGWTLRGLRREIQRNRGELAMTARCVRRFARRGPVVLAGDFNLPPHYAELRKATRALRDAFGTRGFGWGKTVPAKLPGMRIDLIYVPRASRMHYATAVPTSRSDHYMTLAEAAIPVLKTSPEHRSKRLPHRAKRYLRPIKDSSRKSGVPTTSNSLRK
jgi:endonuclease/exonuclease/phosphatase (EEP) superfamily protein YafD